MDSNCPTNLVPVTREKVPKDGPGPRGAPDCYYTSRVLNSTARYVRFVNRLRASEEEQRITREKTIKEKRDQEFNAFLLRCDQAALVNKVARRVDICMLAHQQDIENKRLRLKDLLKAEEEFYMQKFVEEIQAGHSIIWQEKKDRLAFLLNKRQEEKLAKVTDTPLSKCAHVQPCLVKLRAKEAQEVQLYQMREKELRKAAQLEMDNMWHELAMKESDALAARIELDTIERARRDVGWRRGIARQMHERHAQLARAREDLRRDTLYFLEQLEQADRKEAQAASKREMEVREMAAARDQSMRDRQEVMATQRAQGQLVACTWDSLMGQANSEERNKAETRKRVQRELDECNRKMCALKQRVAQTKVDNEPLIEREGRRRLDELCATHRRRRERARGWTGLKLQMNTACLQKQIDEKREFIRGLSDLNIEYDRQVNEQLDQLLQHQREEDARALRAHGADLRRQIAYNELLKNRALQEARAEQKKCQLAAVEYQQEIARMLCRPVSRADMHPFMKQMMSGQLGVQRRGHK